MVIHSNNTLSKSLEIPIVVKILLYLLAFELVGKKDTVSLKSYFQINTLSFFLMFERLVNG